MKAKYPSQRFLRRRQPANLMFSAAAYVVGTATGRTFPLAPEGQGNYDMPG